MIYSNISQVQVMANKYNIGKVYISTRKNKKYMRKTFSQNKSRLVFKIPKTRTKKHRKSKGDRRWE
jgi:hypothetical protein